MADVIQILRQAGFEGEALRQAWAIVMRESGGRPAAFNGNRNTGDQSYGLFQINMLGDMGPARRKQFGLSSNEDLLDPVTNAKVAYRMSGGGKDWGPWAIGPNAYKGAPSNAYAKYKEWYGKFPGTPGSAPPLPPIVERNPTTAPAPITESAVGADPRKMQLLQYLSSRGRSPMLINALYNRLSQETPQMSLTSGCRSG